MKWLKSSTQKSYIFDGKTVPPCVTKNNDWLALTDVDYTKFLENKVVKSLYDGGAIVVTDKEPMTTTDQISSLTTEKANLIRKNTELQEKLAALQDSVAKSEYDALQVKFDDLKKEAEDLLAAKEKEIAELKSQLAAKE